VTLIDTPAFVQIDLLNETQITSRAVSYSDPQRADTYGAFTMTDSDGVTTYVLWIAIMRVVVFPLSAETPSVPKPEPIEEGS